MSSQSKIIKDILSTYDTILENKKISEATDVYDNVNFTNIGHGNPSFDNINIELLQDIDTAAKNAGVKVDITTAVSGHDKKTDSGNDSRHPSGNAVDIAIINNKSVSPSNKEDANKLVDELVKLGYNKNSESGHPKAVLTFGFEGHDDHVHVSNTSGSASSNNPSGNTSGNTSSSAPNQYNITRTMGQALLGTNIGKEMVKSTGLGLSEAKVYSSFGKDYIVRNGGVIIPKEGNKKIKSPVSGNITSFSYNSNCLNQLFIKFKVGDKTFYLEYCGLKSISVRKGDNVSQGEVIGMSDTDIKVTLYGSDGNIKYIDPKLESNKNSNNEYDNRDLNNGFYTSAYRKVRDSWFKKDNVQENIDRIKGLL